MISQHIFIAVDAIIFTVIDEKAHVLLIKRKDQPYMHQYAFPGGFVKDHETLMEAIKRELSEETNLNEIQNIEILDVYDSPNRDARARIMSIAFIGAVEFEKISHVRAGDDAQVAEWVPISEVKDLAFDHNKMFSDALNFLSSF